jgi:hypothetical protein
VPDYDSLDDYSLRRIRGGWRTFLACYSCGEAHWCYRTKFMSEPCWLCDDCVKRLPQLEQWWRWLTEDDGTGRPNFESVYPDPLEEEGGRPA